MTDRNSVNNLESRKDSSSENILILGGTGFIGTNLALKLSQNPGIHLTITGLCNDNIDFVKQLIPSADVISFRFSPDADFAGLVRNQDVVYHLVSTTTPANTNINIPEEIRENVGGTACLLDACVKESVKKVVFISSGGTVYGKMHKSPLSEDLSLYPVSGYGVQKAAVEKLLVLYNSLYSLDYRIIRLSNPYGPYQKHDLSRGVIPTFIYSALTGLPVEVFGDGLQVRDYIYIDDAVKGIINIAGDGSMYKLYNLGSGTGTSVNEIISVIVNHLSKKLDVRYAPSRSGDVAENVLDVTRYEEEFGPACSVKLKDGIKKTVCFMKTYMEEHPH